MSVRNLHKHLLLALLRLISRLPLGVLYACADLMRPLVRLYRRRIVRNNIAGAFPEKTDAERREIERNFYNFFADMVVETLKMLTISEAEIRRRMQFVGVEAMEALLSDHPFVFIYLGHYCNWEWISSLVLWATHCHPGQVYKPQRDAFTDAVLLKMRGKFGCENIDKNKILRRIVELQKADKRAIIGFISDQAPKWESIHDWVTFLGRETPVFTGTERIARRVGAATVFADVERIRRGYYRCTLRPLEADVNALPPYALTERYMNRLEEMIRRNPQYWLWTHNRWKRQRHQAPAQPDGRTRGAD